MFMSDVYLDKMIDKFIADMEKSSIVANEKELYLAEVDDKDFTFKEVRRLI